MTKIRYSKYGKNLYSIIYRDLTPEQIKVETLRLAYRAEQLYGQYDKAYFEEDIINDLEIR